MRHTIKDNLPKVNMLILNQSYVCINTRLYDWEIACKRVIDVSDDEVVCDIYRSHLGIPMGDKSVMVDFPEGSAVDIGGSEYQLKIIVKDNVGQTLSDIDIFRNEEGNTSIVIN